MLIVSNISCFSWVFFHFHLDWKPPHDDGIHDNDDDGSWGPGWGWYWCTEKTHKPTDKPTTKPTSLPAIKTTNPTPQPTHCEERRFYFHYGKCTNEYQRGWTVAGHSGYESLVACCWLNDDHFRDLEHCKEKSTDTCNPYVPSPTKKVSHYSRRGHLSDTSDLTHLFSRHIHPPRFQQLQRKRYIS